MTTATPATIPARQRTRKRPFGVNAIIVLTALSAVSSLVFVALIVAAMYVPAAHVWLEDLEIGPWLAVYVFATGVVQIAIVIGLWRLKRWGWFLVMLHTGLGMFLNLWAYFHAQPNYVTMVVLVLIVFYMNQREVQQAFLEPAAAGPSPAATKARLNGA